MPAPPPSVPDAQAGEAPVWCVLLIVCDRLVTAANSFGIWCDYPRHPTADPDAFLSLVDLSNTHDQSLDPTLLPKLPDQSVPHADVDCPFHWPFPNSTIWRVMSWLNNGKTTKSEAEVTNFIYNAVLSRDFNKDDLVGFNAHREN